MEIQLWQSLLIALWVAMVQSRSFLGIATLTLRFSPMMTGLVCGVVLGDIPSAMIITAAIQMIYMGTFAPGGQMPSEPCVATAIAVPIAILGDLTVESAVAIAVPVGLLGSYLYQFRFGINTVIMKWTDKNAEKVDDAALTRSIIIFPTIASFLLYVPFMFLALQFGAPVVAEFVSANATAGAFHVLSVVGGGLAAIGIALTIYVIGKKQYIVFFLLAYFMSVLLKTLEISMVSYAVIGAIVAAVFVLSKGESTSEV
jgi:Phosphotransferase system, mannose/fructose/N-acetylgalactosamine-specific component IIC